MSLSPTTLSSTSLSSTSLSTRFSVSSVSSMPLELACVAFALCAGLCAVLVYSIYLFSSWQDRLLAREDDSRRAKSAAAAGLDATTIATLTAFSHRHTAANKGKGVGRKCPVCLSAVKEGELVRMLPACCHAFHVACIDQWLARQATCPTCRAGAADLARGPGRDGAGNGAGARGRSGGWLLGFGN